MMARKVGFTHKVTAVNLVEWCPFCGTIVKGKKSHTCKEASSTTAAVKLPPPRFCPLCGGEIEKSGHECPI